MSEVRISAQAEADLTDIWLFIARDNLAAADRQVASILNTSRTLADGPEMGEKRDDLAPGLRQFTVRPRYVIFYRPIEGGIELVRVVSGARDFEALFRLDWRIRCVPHPPAKGARGLSAAAGVSYWPSTSCRPA